MATPEFIAQDDEYDLVFDFVDGCPTLPRHQQLYVIDNTEYGAEIVSGYLQDNGTFIRHGYSTHLSDFGAPTGRLLTRFAFFLHGKRQENYLDEKIFSNRTEYAFNDKVITEKEAESVMNYITAGLQRHFAFLWALPLYPYNEKNGVFIGSTSLDIRVAGV